MIVSRQYIILLNIVVALTAAPCWGAAWSDEEKPPAYEDLEIDRSSRAITLRAGARSLCAARNVAKRHANSFDFAAEIIETSDGSQETSGDSNDNDLLKAANNDDMDGVIRALAKGADVNAVEKDCFPNTRLRTALHIAVGNDNERMVDLLLEKGADIEKADEGGWTPLILAIFWGYGKLVTILLEHKANVNAVATNGETPLMFIADGRYLTDLHQRTAVQLIKAKADVNAVDGEGRSALFLLAKSSHKIGLEGDVKLLKLLIKSKADVDSVLAKAIDNYDEDTARFLVQYGKKTSNLTEAQKAKLVLWEIPQQSHCAVS